MKTYAHPHRSGRDALRSATAHAQQERDGRDRLIVDIAEIDARRYYREAGYDCTLAYCMNELLLSRKAALHRIHVAKVAWRFPAILAALLEGRLRLTAVSLLASHLTEENVDELIEAAGKKPMVELRGFIAERFRRRDLFTASRPAASTESLIGESATEPEPSRRLNGVDLTSATPGRSPQPRPEQIPDTQPAAQLPPERFPLKFAAERRTHEKLHHLRDLLGHQIPSGDLAQVLDRALDVAIAHFEKQKFAITDKPRSSSARQPSNGRYVPAEVRRAVAQRDGGRCTFISESGKRCPARSHLEFDHILEVARGGRSTVENVRLRCRAHNQYTAERTFGAEFMERKRRESQYTRVSQ